MIRITYHSPQKIANISTWKITEYCWTGGVLHIRHAQPERCRWKCRAGSKNPAVPPEMRRRSALPPYNLSVSAFLFEAQAQLQDPG
jgi:hypothetical protein